MAGWSRRRLVVGLSSRKVETQAIPERLQDSFIGGRGINSRLLYDLQKPGIDPLGPDNPLIFAVGPVSGTPIPGSGRFTVSAFSPLTVVGNVAPCLGDSNAGGFWGPEFRYAGYDQLLVQGASDTPVYLWIRDAEAEIRDASSFEGNSTWEAEDAIRKEVGDPRAQVASIGT